MDYRYIVEYASRQAIAPLDAFVGKELDLHDFDQDQITGGKINGKLYGVSLGANSVASVINVTAFKEAGVPVPDNSFTYDDLLTVGQAFVKANIRNGMKAFQDGSGVEPLLENWLRQRGKALYTADGKLGFDAADLTEWFQLWKKFRDAGIIPTPDDQALDTGGPLDKTMIALGKAGQSFVNSNQLLAVQAIMKDEVTLATFPRVGKDGKGGHYRKPSMFWSVANASKIQPDAAKYVSFFINNVDANKVLGVERGIPCSASVRDAISPMLKPQDQVALKFVSSLGDLLGPIPPPPPPNAGEIDVQLLPKSQEVAFGPGNSGRRGARLSVKQATGHPGAQGLEPNVAVRPLDSARRGARPPAVREQSAPAGPCSGNGTGPATPPSTSTPWLAGLPSGLTLGPALITFAPT